MNDVDATDGVVERATRRKHSARFKAEVLEACRQPDASAAAIARLYNLNTNVVHRWRAEDRKAASPKATDVPTLPMPDFIALDVQPEPEMPARDIRIELKRGRAQPVDATLQGRIEVLIDEEHRSASSSVACGAVADMESMEARQADCPDRHGVETPGALDTDMDRQGRRLRPRECHRAPGALALRERKEISRGLPMGQSIRLIAARLSRFAARRTAS